MSWKRVGLGVGAAMVVGASVFAADQYFGFSQGIGEEEPVKLASLTTELAQEAINTDCGLSNATDDNTAKAGVVSASVTRARVTASQSVESGDDIAAAIESGDCRFRLDGVWIEDLPLALDQSVTIEGFEEESGGNLDKSLLHGTFVTPQILLMETSDDGTEVSIRRADEEGNAVAARSADDVSLNEVFRPGGERKRFELSGEIAGESGEMSLDVTRTGRVRIRIGDTNYYRPQATAFGNDVDINDPWMIERNLDNLDASLKGYDAYAQDASQLNENPKGRVFDAANAEDFAVVEKRTVPLGLKLVPEGAQGTVFKSSLIRTQREYQDTVRTSFGMKVGFEGENAAGGIGADYTESRTDGMAEGEAYSHASGFARHKLYALVLDRPFARLSDEFVDAVEDARRYGRYDELIERFGTHYPYAVTYGSGATMSLEFSEQTVSQWGSNMQEVNAQAGVAIGGFGVSVNGGRYTESNESNERFESHTDKYFKAVGGTGSFSEEGHSTGPTPYPILADLRPLHELLNPLNFPGEVEVYTEVRERLQQEIASYLAQFGQELTDVAPVLTEQYTVTPRELYCAKPSKGLPAGFETNPQHLIDGGMTIRVRAGSEFANVSSRSYGRWSDKTINCWTDRARTSALPAQPIRITGPLGEARNASFDWVMDLYSERVTLIRNRITYAKGTRWGFSLPKGMEVGETERLETIIRRDDDTPEIRVRIDVRRDR
ncbi:MAG: MAC/perforin domain-containing protein [Pseudomonadota bacterium]